MKIIITKDQVNLLKEGTNKSVKLLKKYYDIIGGGGRYEGQGKIRTVVSFLRKDSDDDLNHSSFPSYGFWEIGDDDQLIFRSVTLPKPENIPLMEYIGNTDELKEYLKDLHREEAEDILKRINHRRNYPLNEGSSNSPWEEIWFKLRKISSMFDLPSETSETFSVGGLEFQPSGDDLELVPYYRNPKVWRDDYEDGVEVLERYERKLKDLFNEFNDVYDYPFGLYVEMDPKYNITLSIGDKKSLNENVDNKKKFLIKRMGQDFTGKIREIKDSYDVPMEFDESIGPKMINRMIHLWGPMYLVNIKGKKYLYQERGDEYEVYEWFHDENGFNYVDDEILEELGLNELGLRFKDIIDMFYNEGDLTNIVERVISESNADLYNMAIQRIKKNPSESMSLIKSYKPTSQEEQNDKNFYITFIQSVINKSPMTPADYIGKRLGYNMKLFNLIPL